MLSLKNHFLKRGGCDILESLALENENYYYTISWKAWGMKEVDLFDPQRCLLLSVPGSPIWLHCRLWVWLWLSKSRRLFHLFCFFKIIWWFFPLTSDAEHFFVSFLMAICLFSLEGCVFRSFACLYVGYMTFYSWVVRVHDNSTDQSLSRSMICKYFLPLCGLSFHCDTGHWSTKVFHFDDNHLSKFFLFLTCATAVISNNPLLSPVPQRFYLYVYFKVS